MEKQNYANYSAAKSAANTATEFTMFVKTTELVDTRCGRMPYGAKKWFSFEFSTKDELNAEFGEIIKDLHGCVSGLGIEKKYWIASEIAGWSF